MVRMLPEPLAKESNVNNNNAYRLELQEALIEAEVRGYYEAAEMLQQMIDKLDENSED